MNLTFGCIADDDTGATDIAGMLGSQGMRTVVVLDSASPQQMHEWAENADAVVLAIASRALPMAEAYSKTYEACKLLRELRPRCVGVKYCSTFDSTPQGNIGPSIDAAMDVLAQPFTVAVPAFPVNGRTTYMGHHFVGRQLLSESSMRCHPLNPMTNPDLVSHLQSQTKRRVGLAAHPAVRGGVDALRGELKKLKDRGVEIALIDCISDDDLQVIAEAIAELPLITGSSGYATTLPAQWKAQGYWSDTQAPCSVARANTSSGTLILSGSCSEATRAQSRFLENAGVRAFALDGLALASGDFDREELVEEVVGILESGSDVFIKTSSTQMEVELVQQWAVSNGSDAISVGARISDGLGALAAEVVRRTLPQVLIVAGGETSGTVCRALGVKALRIGRNIVPGVPLCASITAPVMPMILKSGNFGGEDFFGRALEAIRGCSQEEGEAGKHVC